MRLIDTHDAPTEALSQGHFLRHASALLEDKLNAALTELFVADQAIEISEEYQYGLELIVSRGDIGRVTDTIIALIDRLRAAQTA